MIDKDSFSTLREATERFEEEREHLIRGSRDILAFSKRVIAALHKDDLQSAETLNKEMRVAYDSFLKGFPDAKLQEIGSFRVAVQEYVEAAALFSFIKEGRLPTPDELNANAEGYLLGVCDLTGELVRLAVNSGIREDYGMVSKVREFTSSLYEQLLTLTVRRGELRKKIDGVRWNLQKMDDLTLNLKMRDKL